MLFPWYCVFSGRHILPVDVVRPGKDPAEKQSAGGKTHRARGLGDVVGIDSSYIDICVCACMYIYIYINYSVYFIYILCIYIYICIICFYLICIYFIYIYIICIYYIHTYVLYLWTIAYDVDTVCEDLTILVRYGDGIGRRILSCEVL